MKTQRRFYGLLFFCFVVVSGSAQVAGAYSHCTVNAGKCWQQSEKAGRFYHPARRSPSYAPAQAKFTQSLFYPAKLSTSLSLGHSAVNGLLFCGRQTAFFGPAPAFQYKGLATQCALVAADQPLRMKSETRLCPDPVQFGFSLYISSAPGQQRLFQLYHSITTIIRSIRGRSDQLVIRVPEYTNTNKGSVPNLAPPLNL